ncbi:hypothetical protein JCM6882_002885 [Rhodosporidiobolus microsporus]
MAPVIATETTVDAAYKVSFEWDVELALEDLPEGETILPLKQPAPLVGAWQLSITRGSGETVATVTFEHGELAEGALGSNVKVSGAFFYVLDGEKQRICRYTWGQGAESDGTRQPEQDGEGATYTGFDLPVRRWELDRVARLSDGDFDPKTHRQFVCTLRVEQKYAPSDESPASPDQMTLQAGRMAELHRQQLPHDVRLYFPHAHPEGAELWANSDVLSQTSSYLKTLLNSDFAESTPRRAKRARTDTTAEVKDAPPPAMKDFADSDDEADAFLFSKKPPQLESPSGADEVPYRQVTITQTAFSTYHAVLVYLQTGSLHYAPLSSSRLPLDAKAQSSRHDSFVRAYDKNPSLPLPISPKSAYRLAHLLRLSALQTECLDLFKHCLSISGVALELFSDMSIAYDDYRRILINFVLRNLDAVRKSASWKAETARMKQEDPANAASILLELFEAQEADSDKSDDEN